MEGGFGKVIKETRTRSLSTRVRSKLSIGKSEGHIEWRRICDIVVSGSKRELARHMIIDEGGNALRDRRGGGLSVAKKKKRNHDRPKAIQEKRIEYEFGLLRGHGVGECLKTYCQVEKRKVVIEGGGSDRQKTCRKGHHGYGSFINRKNAHSGGQVENRGGNGCEALISSVKEKVKKKRK